MKLEDQVVSLELAKKLKELGVKQESVFHWLERQGGNPPLLILEPVMDKNPNRCSAFTVAELGEMLPAQVRYFWLRCEKIATGKWGIAYYEEDRDGDFVQFEQFWEQTEADARAKMLIYLIENKLVEGKQE